MRPLQQLSAQQAGVAEIAGSSRWQMPGRGRHYSLIRAGLAWGDASHAGMVEQVCHGAGAC